MLQLLLDEHISPDVATGLHRRRLELVVYAMKGWAGGILLGQEDSVCLAEANHNGLTFVTYDRRTIPPLLKQWTEEGRHHGGVIFVDEKTISPADIGGLITALAELAKTTYEWVWQDRICFLRH